ncbi:MAG: hypothetical protein ACI8RD_006288 [Bacillariaceae sp.]|jgi:hypothetical protein
MIIFVVTSFFPDLFSFKKVLTWMIIEILIIFSPAIADLVSLAETFKHKYDAEKKSAVPSKSDNIQLQIIL